MVIFYVYEKLGSIMIKEGAIGLAFKFFDLLFYVIRILWIVVELGVIRT